MNTLQSLWLIKEIYFKKDLPDLDKIQSLGLLAVKIGQIHALRLDFLSAEKCHHLSKLYRSNNQIAQEDIDLLIKNSVGEAWKNNFNYIEKTPLAIASVGQVYKAELKNGQKVVIKIIKNKFKQRFVSDVNKLKFFFKLVLKLYPKLKGVGNPLGILEDIEMYTLAELDLRNEQKGTEILKQLQIDNQNDFDLSKLKFINYYPELSNENILVSDYVDAPTLDELLQEKKLAYSDLLNLFYLQGFYIFYTGKFHGDFHPGNIMFDGDSFYFVDTAFVGAVNDNLRKGLFFFFEALADCNYEQAGHWLNQMSDIRLTGADYDKFKVGFLDIYKDFAGKTVGQASLTKQMMLTIKWGVNSGMQFEKGIFSIIRCFMYWDGMVLKCNPDAILMNDMKRYITAFKNYV
jgi:ubiquinone biosynthesis protein